MRAACTRRILRPASSWLTEYDNLGENLSVSPPSRGRVGGRLYAKQDTVKANRVADRYDHNRLQSTVRSPRASTDFHEQEPRNIAAAVDRVQQGFYHRRREAETGHYWRRHTCVLRAEIGRMEIGRDMRVLRADNGRMKSGLAHSPPCCQRDQLRGLKTIYRHAAGSAA